MLKQGSSPKNLAYARDSSVYLGMTKGKRDSSDYLGMTIPFVILRRNDEGSLNLFEKAKESRIRERFLGLPRNDKGKKRFLGIPRNDHDNVKC